MHPSLLRTLATAALCLLLLPSSVLSQENDGDDMGRPCGFKIAPCEPGSTCSALDPACPATRHENCAGVCRPSTTVNRTTTKPTPTANTTTTTMTKKPTSRTRPTQPPHRYDDCGGKRVVPKDCAAGYLCVDDPYRGGCGMACDAPGICVRPTTPCSGVGGRRCPGGMMCVDDPRDDCWPASGGRDCGGICV